MLAHKAQSGYSLIKKPDRVWYDFPQVDQFFV